jgi:hypothetical protein
VYGNGGDILGPLVCQEVSEQQSFLVDAEITRVSRNRDDSPIVWNAPRRSLNESAQACSSAPAVSTPLGRNPECESLGRGPNRTTRLPQTTHMIPFLMAELRMRSAKGDRRRVSSKPKFRHALAICLACPETRTKAADVASSVTCEVRLNYTHADTGSVVNTSERSELPRLQPCTSRRRAKRGRFAGTTQRPPPGLHRT